MDAKKYLSKIGKKGGEARAKNHSKEVISKWGKLGGRPKKSIKTGIKDPVENPLQ